ncbi:MAG: ROK family protein [Muribaculaceae bacterium]|nr:ROK family protein [Muribaculaceae bacterium]
MKENLLGVDIGGTKCAVIYGIKDGDSLEIADKIRFETTNVTETVDNILLNLDEMMRRHELTPQNTLAVGVSCGGPLSSEKGVVMSPPNLPGWDNIPICEIITNRTGIKTNLQNDANACAIAEWKFGAGRGTRNMVFLTFGTGLGAGIIANGQIYAGTNDNAGEVGHIRLSEWGPVGYGKAGSFEGFDSGGGIAQIARTLLTEHFQMGGKVDWCTPETLPQVTAKLVAEQAAKGDPIASRVFQISALYLGRGLSIIIDILNPEVIVIGSIFARCEDLLRPQMQQIIDCEALPGAARVCRVLPAELGEAIGDYASLSVACI